MAISDYFISRWVFFRMSWSSLGTVVFSAPRSGTKTSTRQVIACEVYFFIFYVDITRQSFVRKRPKKLKTFVPRRVSEVRLDGIVSIYIRPTISYCQTLFSVYFCCGKLLKPFPLKAGENYIGSALSSYLSFFFFFISIESLLLWPTTHKPLPQLFCWKPNPTEWSDLWGSWEVFIAWVIYHNYAHKKS